MRIRRLRSATVRRYWMNANYVVGISVATIGWLWFFGWLAIKLFVFVGA